MYCRFFFAVRCHPAQPFEPPRSSKSYWPSSTNSFASSWQTFFNGFLFSSLIIFLYTLSTQQPEPPQRSDTSPFIVLWLTKTSVKESNKCSVIFTFSGCATGGRIMYTFFFFLSLSLPPLAWCSKAISYSTNPKWDDATPAVVSTRVKGYAVLRLEKEELNEKRRRGGTINFVRKIKWFLHTQRPDLDSTSHKP